MGIQVRATQTGYYDNKRFREGALIEMDEAHIHFDENGELVSPKWVELVEKPLPKSKGRKVKDLASAPVSEAEDVI